MPTVQHTTDLYFRFTLSYRDVEKLLAQRALDFSYEAVRRWGLKFGPLLVSHLRQRCARPGDCWRFNERDMRIACRRMLLWRALDQKGEILDLLVQPRWDKRGGVRPIRQLLLRCNDSSPPASRNDFLAFSATPSICNASLSRSTARLFRAEGVVQ